MFGSTTVEADPNNNSAVLKVPKDDEECCVIDKSRANYHKKSVDGLLDLPFEASSSCNLVNSGSSSVQLSSTERYQIQVGARLNNLTTRLALLTLCGVFLILGMLAYMTILHIRMSGKYYLKYCVCIFVFLIRLYSFTIFCSWYHQLIIVILTIISVIVTNAIETIKFHRCGHNLTDIQHKRMC